MQSAGLGLVTLHNVSSRMCDLLWEKGPLIGISFHFRIKLTVGKYNFLSFNLLENLDLWLHYAYILLIIFATYVS